MHSYATLKQRHGRAVSQTIDSPILIFDYFELSDAFAALFIIMIFGVLLYAWTEMFLLLVLCLGAGPQIKRKQPKGIYLHCPYRNLGMKLPGLFNPRGTRRFSD